jgi:hypothetical protein
VTEEFADLVIDAGLNGAELPGVPQREATDEAGC